MNHQRDKLKNKKVSKRCHNERNNLNNTPRFDLISGKIPQELSQKVWNNNLITKAAIKLFLWHLESCSNHHDPQSRENQKICPRTYYQYFPGILKNYMTRLKIVTNLKKIIPERLCNKHETVGRVRNQQNLNGRRYYFIPSYYSIPSSLTKCDIEDCYPDWRNCPPSSLSVTKIISDTDTQTFLGQTVRWTHWPTSYTFKYIPKKRPTSSFILYVL